MLTQLPAAQAGPAPSLPILFQPELEAAREFADAAMAASSRRAYRSDWRVFCAWCATRDAEPLPASPEVVAAFLAAEARTGVKVSTLSRRLAAIAFAHRLRGYRDPPTGAETVRTVLRGIKRELGLARTQKAAATADLVREMLKHCPDTLAGRRDRALIALGFAGAFRRSELVALEVSDLVEVADGLRIVIRRSKTDQEGQGQEIAIPRGYRLRPVEAVQTWLAAAEISAGPVFRPVYKGQRVQPCALLAGSVAEIVKTSARRAGLDPTQFAGHSLRAGFITSAAESGAALLRIADQSRHKSLDVLRGYVRRADLFKDHAGAAFL